MRRGALFLLISAWSLFADLTRAASPATVITADGGMTFENDVAIASGNARMDTGKDVLRAKRVQYDTVKKQGAAEGSVRLFSEGRLYAGERLEFFPESNVLNSAPFRFLQGELMLEGDRLETLPSGSGSYFYRVRNGSLSPDNLETPTFRMRSREIDYHPDKRVVLRNTTFYIGRVPFFWWPIYSQSLKRNENNFNVDAGRDDLQGLFLKTQYAYAITSDLTARGLFDLRSRRGLGGGAKVSWTPSDAVYVHFRAYYAQDNASDYNRYLLPRGSTSASRDILSLQQRYEGWRNLTLTSDLNRWSDPHVTEDFFRREYRKLRQPDNFIEALWTEPDFSLSLLNRFSSHSFFETVERTPELRLDVKRYRLFPSGPAYESQSSIARLSFHQAREPEPLRGDYATWRLDTLQQLVYPVTLREKIQVTPRVALRATHWTETSPLNPSAADSTDDRTRIVPIIGVDLSMKFHRTWKEFKSPFLRLNGVRHIVEPFLSIHYVPKPNVEMDSFRAWDRRLPDQRIDTLNPLLETSIDSLTEELRFVPGLRQKWQTRRDGETLTWLDWNLYTEVNPLRIYNEEQRSDRRALGNLHSRIEFTPYHWLRFDSLISMNMVRGNYSEVNTQLSWQLHPALHFAIGHHHLQGSALYPSSNLFYLQTFYRINESWQISSTHSFEAADGRLESMRYSVYRDFTSWQLSLTYEGTPHRGRAFEHAFYLGFTLKAFPEENLTFSQ
jgi:LPS-assembly protein